MVLDKPFLNGALRTTLRE